MRRTGRAFALVVAATAVLAGCGGDKSAGGEVIRGTTLTVYSSVPLHGASRLNAQSVVNGEQLALERAGWRVGHYRIVLHSLDDSIPQRGAWDPGQTTVNARVASTDPTTVAYIGEFNSGASAVSIPLLNRVGIPQVSPSSTAVGLTSDEAGAAPGEPQKYYPTGLRSFARVVPNDVVQAGALVRLQQSLGCRRAYAVDDGEVDGEDLADSYQLVARSAGLDVVGVQAFQPRATDYTGLARSVAQTGADCVLISAITESGAPLVTRQIAAAMPQARIFGSDGVAETTFTDPALGGIPIEVGPRVLLTSPTIPPGAGEPMAHSFYSAYQRRFGTPQPYAIYGYEAMSLVLDAIGRASDGGRHPVRRAKVLQAIFQTADRQSVLGTYSIRGSGDTTVRRYGVYRVVDGRMVFWKAIVG